MKPKILDKIGIILMNMSHTHSSQIWNFKAKERCWVDVAVPDTLYF